MPVKVRLTRVGNRNNPIWRVVVADDRSPRDGRFIEVLGHYNPQRAPSEIAIDRDRLASWLARGAQPTRAVRRLVEALERGRPPAAEVRADEAAAARRSGVAANAGAATAEQGSDAEAAGSAEATTDGGAAAGSEPSADSAGDAAASDSSPGTAAAASAGEESGEGGSAAGEEAGASDSA